MWGSQSRRRGGPICTPWNTPRPSPRMPLQSMSPAVHSPARRSARSLTPGTAAVLQLLLLLVLLLVLLLLPPLLLLLPLPTTPLPRSCRCHSAFLYRRHPPAGPHPPPSAPFALEPSYVFCATLLFPPCPPTPKTLPPPPLARPPSAVPVFFYLSSLTVLSPSPCPVRPPPRPPLPLPPTWLSAPSTPSVSAVRSSLPAYSCSTSCSSCTMPSNLCGRHVFQHGRCVY